MATHHPQLARRTDCQLMIARLALRVRRRHLQATAALVSTVVACVVLTFGLAPLPATAATGGTRFEGPDRYATAAALFRSKFESAGEVVLARGDDYADALAGSFASGFSSTGVLLTQPDSVPQVTLDELERSDATTVEIMGGPEAVSPGVEQQLRDAGYEVRRTAGSDRYDTAARTTSRAAIGQKPVAILTSGVNFADALSAGPVVYRSQFPLLLTPPDELHPATERALLEGRFERVVILGGEEAVSAAVAQQVRETCQPEPNQDRCPVVERVSGPDRLATAAAFATSFGRDIQAVHLTRGDTFPDALAGAPFAGIDNHPLLLAAGPDSLGDATRIWLEDHAEEVDTVNVFGSPLAVSDDVWSAARAAAQTPQE